MTGSRRVLRPAAAMLAAALMLPAARAGGALDESFMPKGGKALLLDWLAAPENAPRTAAALSDKRSEEEWRAFFAAGGKNLGERELGTLAAYASLNLPPAAGAGGEAGDRARLAAALPADGRELAWNQCQSCHSLFAGYLTQNRDANGWRSIFLSPFHRQMKMSAQEREEFARYSALNMPMKVDAVPEDLRF